MEKSSSSSSKNYYNILSEYKVNIEEVCRNKIDTKYREEDSFDEKNY